MTLLPKTNPFNLPIITKKIEALQQKFFNAEKGLLYFPGVSNEQTLYFSEQKLTESSDEGKKVLNWLLRVERYFAVDSLQQDSDSRKNTAVLITQFITDLKNLTDKTQHYLLSNNDTLNLIFLGLMMCSEEATWIQTIALIKSFHKDAKELMEMLDWAYGYYFSKLDKQSFYINLIDDYIQQCPESPLSHLNQFYTSYRSYQTTIMVHTIDQEQLKLIFLAKTLYHAIFLREYSNANPKAIDTFTSLAEDFIALLAETPKSKWLKSDPRFLTTLEYVMISAFCATSSASKKEHLGRIIEVMHKMSPITYSYQNNSLKYGKVLPLVLFKKKEFELAKMAFAELFFYMNVSSAMENELYQLLCFCSELQRWLKDTSKTIDLKNIPQLFTDKKATIPSELKPLAIPVLLDFGLALAEYSMKTTNNVQLDKAAQYYELFKHHVPKDMQQHIEYVRNTKNRAIAKTNQTLFLKELEKDSKKHKKTVVKKAPMVIEDTFVKEEQQPEIIKNDKIKLEQTGILYEPLRDQIQLIEELTQPTVSELSLFKPHHIAYKKFPKTFHDTMSQLKKQFPGCVLVLTGSAIEHLNSGKQPNDYDVLMIQTTEAKGKSSVYHVVDFLNQLPQFEKKPCKIFSTKNVIAHCPLEQHPPIEIRFVELPPKMALMDYLYQDFKKRDYNLTSQYCIINSKKQWPIFSFDNALVARNNGIIMANQEPIALYREDPTRVFRLMRIVIAYPKFVLDKNLVKALKTLDNQWGKLFQEYGTKDSAHAFRTENAINKIIARHTEQEISQAKKILHFNHSLSTFLPVEKPQNRVYNLH